MTYPLQGLVAKAALNAFSQSTKTPTAGNHIGITPLNGSLVVGAPVQSLGATQTVALANDFTSSAAVGVISGNLAYDAGGAFLSATYTPAAGFSVKGLYIDLCFYQACTSGNANQAMVALYVNPVAGSLPFSERLWYIQSYSTAGGWVKPEFLTASYMPSDGIIVPTTITACLYNSGTNSTMTIASSNTTYFGLKGIANTTLSVTPVLI